MHNRFRPAPLSCTRSLFSSRGPCDSACPVLRSERNSKAKLKKMSGGPVHIQRRLLAIFRGANRPLDTFRLAAWVYCAESDAYGDAVLTAAQLSSVRRALIRLSDKGLLCGVRGPHNGRQLWARPHIFVSIEQKTPGSICQAYEARQTSLFEGKAKSNDGPTGQLTE